MEQQSKVIDILVATLTDTLKSVDSAVVVAYSCAGFFLVEAAQGKFATAVATALQTTRDHSNAAPEVVEITPLGLKADIYTASLVVLVLYWVFSFRAYFRARQIKAIVEQLFVRDREVLDAVLLTPSFATGRRRVKWAACCALGALAFVGFGFMYFPLLRLTSVTPTDTLKKLAWAGLWMLIPPAFLVLALSRIPSRWDITVGAASDLTNRQGA